MNPKYLQMFDCIYAIDNFTYSVEDTLAKKYKYVFLQIELIVSELTQSIENDKYKKAKRTVAKIAMYIASFRKKIHSNKEFDTKTNFEKVSRMEMLNGITKLKERLELTIKGL